MHTVLSPVETGYGNPDKRRAVDNCRLACLIFLNAAMAEHGDFSEPCEHFLSSFAQFAEDDDEDCTLSAEHLLWYLIRGFGDPKTDEWTWMTSRMIGVMKRSGQQTWESVETSLRLFLIMPEDGSEMVNHLTAWDPEKFYQDLASLDALVSFSRPVALYKHNRVRINAKQLAEYSHASR